jgi:hypothetical protein
MTNKSGTCESNCNFDTLKNECDNIYSRNQNGCLPWSKPNNPK